VISLSPHGRSLPDSLWLILKRVIPSSLRYCYGGSFGALPALFGSAYFGELATLEGAAGAKQVIQKHLEKVQLLLFSEGEIDVDTPGDFARLESTNYSDTSKSADLN